MHPFFLVFLTPPQINDSDIIMPLTNNLFLPFAILLPLENLTSCLIDLVIIITYLTNRKQFVVEITFGFPFPVSKALVQHIVQIILTASQMEVQMLAGIEELRTKSLVLVQDNAKVFISIKYRNGEKRQYQQSLTITAYIVQSWSVKPYALSLQMIYRYIGYFCNNIVLLLRFTFFCFGYFRICFQWSTRTHKHW